MIVLLLLFTLLCLFFFFNDPATTEIYTLSLHDALPIFNDFERILAENDTLIVKFFLHISKGEQRRRLLERLADPEDRKSTRLNSSHEWISYAVFCLKKKKIPS